MQTEIETIVREMLLRRAAAQDALELVGPRCRRRPTGACADLVRMETANEVWGAAILLLAPLLAERGQP